MRRTVCAHSAVGVIRFGCRCRHLRRWMWIRFQKVLVHSSDNHLTPIRHFTPHHHNVNVSLCTESDKI